MVEKTGAGLEESEKMLLYQLLLAYSDFFFSSGTDLGRTGVIQHKLPPPPPPRPLDSQSDGFPRIMEKRYSGF